MSDVLVVSGSYTPNPTDFACLSESAERNQVPLFMKRGDFYPPYPVLFQQFIEFLRDRPEKYFVFSDAHDVLVNRWDSVAVRKLIDESAAGVVIPTESHCWPPGPWCDVYEGRKTSPWCYVNGGGCAGYKQPLIDLLNIWIEKISENTLGANQQLMHKMLGEGYPLTLDTECVIWQTMLFMTPESRGHVVLRDGLAYNDVTGTFPMFLHFNGATPGIRKWYEALGYSDWKQTGCKPE